MVEFDALYSVNAKKVEAGTNAQSFQALTSTAISIRDLLKIVNGLLYSDILPKSVNEHFATDRRETKLSDQVSYELKDPDDAAYRKLERKNTQLEKKVAALKQELKRTNGMVGAVKIDNNIFDEGAFDILFIIYREAIPVVF